MKKLLMVLCFFTLTQASMSAQSVKYGIRLGISTPDVKPGELGTLTLKSASETLSLQLNEANYGFHGGIWARVGFAKLYLQPEVVFNSTKSTYKVTKTGGGITDSLRKETFNNLDVPVMLGVKLGSFRLNVGPVAHFRIGGSSELTNLVTIKENFKSATYGYQAGLGFDAGKVGIDLRYEGNFSNYGSSITFGGNAYQFDKKPSRLTAAVAIAF